MCKWNLRELNQCPESADRVFSDLMGEEVAPRKAFIQAHATSVRNLDV